MEKTFCEVFFASYCRNFTTYPKSIYKPHSISYTEIVDNDKERRKGKGKKMKVTSSKLFEQKKPILKQLLDRLLQTYSYASILMTDSKGKQYTISKQGISITENMFVESGYVAKVYDGESYWEYAFSHIDENEIDSIAEEIKNHVMPWAKKLPEDMKVKQYPEIPDEAYHFEKSTD